MKRYRKKPVVIEAVLWNGTRTRMIEIARWVEPTTVASSQEDDDFEAELDWTISIETLEGSMWATKGDYIIKGVMGEFYPCKPDIFEATYEEVD